MFKAKTLVSTIALLIIIIAVSPARVNQFEVKATNGIPVHNLDTGLSYTSIQAAINADETSNGDTILVDSGTYIESISVSKSVRILGESWTNTTILGAWAYPWYSALYITASEVTISNFTITDQGEYDGSNCDLIYISPNSENNVITNCNISSSTHNDSAIYLKDTANNTICGNIIGSYYGLVFENASYNHISNNVINDRTSHITLFTNSSNNLLDGNKMANCEFYISDSSRSILRDNVINCTTVGFRISGYSIDEYIQDIDESNTLNGRPFYYWIGQQDKRVPQDAGFVALVSSSNITVQSLNLENSGIFIVNSTWSAVRNVEVVSSQTCIELYESAHNTLQNITITSPERQGRQGISIRYSSHNEIIDCRLINRSWATESIILLNSSFNHLMSNTISDCQYGIQLVYSDFNVFTRNEISHTRTPMYFYESHNNQIHHNNVINNLESIAVESSYNNVWDAGYPSGGNYWGNYSGSDLNQDGIGDSPYPVDANNTDHYPLMGLFSSFTTSLGERVNVISNSTLENFTYFQSNGTIKMHVSNMTAKQTHGFVRICIPHALMTEPYNITVNGANPTYWNYTLYDNGTHRWIYFAYEHSTLEIIIVPEFPSLLTLPLLMIGTLIVALVYKRKSKA